MKAGYVQVYTGNGKGKTTAALGLLMRACGAGLRVYLGQFLKGQPAGENILLSKRFPEVRAEQFGTPRFVGKHPSPEDLHRALKGIEKVKRAMLGGRYDVVIADEIITAVRLGVITERAVLDLMAAKPKTVELVLTGRGATRAIRRAADLVTEMKNIKHYYRKNVAARQGIEW
ncbi:MAG: cob(I)yrinic acid a,c-diamide adenosyltransferase [Kiritimatiellae bacterium]|nr:cob(I)yrinic acid a,c-diamide adenosyltransferase [Kiritimatiellia bacterium]